ncbi:hypothetical protein CEXT_715241 [Caerostris extrusa]|uniref:Uncharacterized protein n=1 Tax=Caerostris extrusa TaxID=172846 RepID=A0AAV4WZ39_CAEEX|nr:hypothetical protein CEXT_715241 [Caerostris extrusa]
MRIPNQWYSRYRRSVEIDTDTYVTKLQDYAKCRNEPVWILTIVQIECQLFHDDMTLRVPLQGLCNAASYLDPVNLRKCLFFSSERERRRDIEVCFSPASTTEND